ncbi:hypothetical protein ACIP4Q_19400 [Streptomyces massasporeus]
MKRVLSVAGYPDARETPVGRTDKPFALGRTQQRIACPGFGGGASGSPCVNGDGTTPGVSCSVVLGAEARRLYRQAAGRP